MRKIFVCLIIAFACAAVFGQQRILKKNVAVVETLVDDASGAEKDISRAEIRVITDEIRNEAVNNLPQNRFNIMTTETVLSMGGAVLEECAEENCVITLGSKIGADYIVRGIISKFRNNLTIAIEIFDTEYGLLIAKAPSIRTANLDELLEKTTAGCREMYKKFLDAAPITMFTPSTSTSTPPTPPKKQAVTIDTLVGGSDGAVGSAVSREDKITIDTLAAADNAVGSAIPSEEKIAIDTSTEEIVAVTQDEEAVSAASTPEPITQQPAGEYEPSEEWEASSPDNRAFYFEALGGYHSAGSSTGWVARGTAAYFLRSEHLHKFGLALGIGAAGSEQGVAYNRTAANYTVLRDTIEFTSTVVSLHVQPIYRIGSHKRRLDVLASVTLPLSASATLGGAEIDIDAEIGYSFGAGGRYEFVGAAVEASEDAVSAGPLFYWAVTPLVEIVPSYTYTYFRIGGLKSGHLFSLRVVMSL